MHRTLAIVERELRRFTRSPMLIVMAMIMPLVQLVVLGYAFGGNVKHLKLAVVDQDRGVPAVKVRELAARSAVTVHSLSVQSTTLDDVFVHYTGRALRDALQEANPLERGPMLRRA